MVGVTSGSVTSLALPGNRGVSRTQEIPTVLIAWVIMDSWLAERVPVFSSKKCSSGITTVCQSSFAPGSNQIRCWNKSEVTGPSV